MYTLYIILCESQIAHIYLYMFIIDNLYIYYINVDLSLFSLNIALNALFSICVYPVIYAVEQSMTQIHIYFI